VHWPTRAGAIKDRASRAPPPGPDFPALGYGPSYGVSCREDYPFATQAGPRRGSFPDNPSSIQGEGAGGWAYVDQDCCDVWKVPAGRVRRQSSVVVNAP
jgi:hypothetical protein